MHIYTMKQQQFYSTVIMFSNLFVELQTLTVLTKQ